MSKLKKEFRIYGRIWVETEEGAVLGSGRIDLLKKIQEYGSLSKAARSMKMSYRQAWELVDSMNKKADAPLVLMQKGGKDGGGASLTTKGEKAIKEFTRITKRFHKFLSKETDSFML